MVSLSGFAQERDILKSLETKKPGEGTVIIHQDSRISALIGSSRSSIDSESGSSTEKRSFKSYGYRVQVYAGSNTRKGKEEALIKASQVKEIFPNIPVYVYFANPRWLCRVGDFKSIEEADAVLRRLKTEANLREASIIKEQINIQY